MFVLPVSFEFCQVVLDCLLVLGFCIRFIQSFIISVRRLKFRTYFLVLRFPWCDQFAMGKAVGTDSIRNERIEASTTSDDLLVFSPASVVGPNTPEAALHRRMVPAFLLDSFSTDCDDYEMEFVTYDDNDVVDMMEEPVAMSRVRAYAFAQGSRGPESKVTLESARAKLDRVKATREKHMTKRKLENFLSGHMDAELREQPKKVKATRISVEKARANLEAVKIEKEITNTKGNRHVNTYITSPPARTRRAVSEAESIDTELPHEGVWVQHAKVKLEAAREKKSKPSRKRCSGALGSKKRKLPRKSSSEISCTDRKNEVDEFDTANAPDGIRDTVECIIAKEASMKGKKRKASKQKAVRVSERIANSRLRMQQGLLTLNVKDEIGSGKTKLRRNKRNKREESSLKICSDLCGKKKETEATASERDTESSPALPMDFTSFVELTPSAKRGKYQRVFVDVCCPGARLSSSVECVPPVSPYGLIQEHLYQDPWKVLVACMLLNKTGGRQMHKVIWDFFELCPDAETCISIETEKIGLVIHSLGLQNKRAKTLQRFSQDYLGTTWTNVTQLHGIGEYARDAYAIFCEGRWQDVQPNDIVLNKYWQWLSDTEGLGYGFSQIE